MFRPLGGEFKVYSRAKSVKGHAAFASRAPSSANVRMPSRATRCLDRAAACWAPSPPCGPTPPNLYVRSERFAALGSEPPSERFGDQHFQDIPAVSKIHSSAWDRTENPANSCLPRREGRGRSRARPGSACAPSWPFRQRCQAFRFPIVGGPLRLRSRSCPERKEAKYGARHQVQFGAYRPFSFLLRGGSASAASPVNHTTRLSNTYLIS